MNSSTIIKNKTLSPSNVSTEIFSLINDIRPQWTPSNTYFRIFTEGLTNRIIGLFSQETSNNHSDALVIKIYGTQTDLFIDRQAEINALNRLTDYGVFQQRVLIQFQNGIIYQFVTGETCSREEIRHDKYVVKSIATKLAHFHSVPINEVQEPHIHLLLRRFIEILQEQPCSDLTSIIQDVDQIKNEVLPRLIPNPQIGQDLVLCHNDLLVKNIIYNRSNQTVSFIDFEYAQLNYAFFDIANHFVEYAGVENADFNIYPTRDEQKTWLKIYFEARDQPDRIIDDNLCYLIDQFSALAHLMWGLWALVQVRLSQIDFDYLHYANLRFSRYQKLRPILFDHETYH